LGGFSARNGPAWAREAKSLITCGFAGWVNDGLVS
jgi:hypothetical protein